MSGKLLPFIAAMAIFGLSLAPGCGDNNHNNSTSNYQQTNLVFSNISAGFSNISGVGTRDPQLINAWGIAHSPTGPWWVNANGSGVSKVYNNLGQPFPIGAPIVVTIPPPASAPGTTSTPTGIVFNNFSGSFNVTTGVPATSARFIFVTEDGTISAWHSGTSATLMVDNHGVAAGTGAVYKGAALAANGTSNLLYAANFRAQRVDVFDSNFAPVTLSGAPFTVPSSAGHPAGYSPFNIANIGGKLYVTYALLNTTTLLDDVSGPGHGFVEVFNPDGTFVMSLRTGSWLNSPWGVAQAPGNFGQFSNTILVGNFGSGQIAAFNPTSGQFEGLLNSAANTPIVIDGLWGIGFGNGGTAGPTNTLFFAAGPNDESNGLFGTLTVK
ncbi:TIGR03118 family protein [Geobacter sp. SVR]|uniref:TIGR03118 family protein n=1 Tax=Geobacter sp. SVR TaxID=2495594 RepID=UPI00143EF951|nr:TIGR03118 family protein [Geobacter sp. SVR]BCS55411.1 hypothetical protein GSVR_37190 [Geobacter sp. SVR]GCF83413.1 hypothetical protein GSbR_00130 [Geobacter sp. SVR]